MSNQPIPPPKRPQSWKIATITLLVVVVAMSAIIGVLLMNNSLPIDNTLPPPISESEYTRIKVFSGSNAIATFDNYQYSFLYKWDLHPFDPEKPIEIIVRGNSETIPAIAGRTYDILGIQIVVSEAYEEYVVLLVRSS